MIYYDKKTLRCLVLKKSSVRLKQKNKRRIFFNLRLQNRKANN